MILRLRFCAYTIILLVCVTTYANAFGTITGKVLDGFGTPIEGVTVQIKGTDFSTTTDNMGDYEINYRPGITKMSFSKNSYTNSVVSVNTSELTDLDFKPITLWKYPKKGGLYFIEDKNYVLINKTAFSGEKNDDSLRFVIKDDPTITNKNNVVILDYEQSNPLVIGKNLYKVYDNNLIGCLGPSEFPLKIVDDKYIKVANNMGLRVATLEPGKYFYYNGYMNHRTRKGQGAFFEIKP